MNPPPAASASAPALVIVALGSNLGDSRGTLTAAIAQLAEFSAVPLRCSAFWRSEPVDCPPGSPAFINAVVALQPRPGLTPEGLLPELLALERHFGRPPRGAVNEPRPLDLDLIAWGNEVRHTPELILPHPRAHRRRFVLQPLAEIAPELVLPGQSRSVAELLAALPAGEVVARL
jgi:2-amino-4-hydroxy-6-hydroxymethyldihydropteridine diphosphokinase